MTTKPTGRGGRRSNAGRPRTAEPSKVMRVPLRQVPFIRAVIAGDKDGTPTDLAVRFRQQVWVPVDAPTEVSCTLYQSRVAAGFPSPADDDREGQLDLNRYLIDRPAATFFVRVQGDSMLNAGIHPGDLLIVDRSREVADGTVIIAVVNGELTVKRLRRTAEQVLLCPENAQYQPLTVTEEMDFHIWGVVRHVIHSL